MIRLECILARMTNSTTVPDFINKGQTRVLEDVFSYSSNNDIDLTVNAEPMRLARLASSGVWALDLHEALAELTRNPPPPYPSQRIAVLYADHYKPFKDALGVMFDRGFDPGDDPSSASQFTRSPREGCAVFTEAIARARGTPMRIAQEELFTTIHELGHVFNLQHTMQPSFMVQGGSAANQFTASDQAMLRCCSSSANVWPGGKPFSDTGKFSHLNFRVVKVAEVPGLSLRIGMGQKEFWPFEPVELDIELRLAKSRQRAMSVPHAVDPGYDTFQIWIEEPNGERRLYRSPRRYCTGDAKLRLEPGGSFLRDVSIFGESGGYTFRTSGSHKLWATFEAKRGVRIQSNVIEVYVRGHSDTQQYAEAKAALQHSVRGKFLYHRLAEATPPGQLRRLKAFAEAKGKLESKGSVQYALGKALATQQLDSGRAASKGAIELLSRAFDAQDLGKRQREATAELLKRISGSRVSAPS
ncbi:MAG: hypothetical protein U1E77_10050 [Inhella sp.]